ncbi:MAG: hypothetical protein LH480_08500 [Rubrivivax sp.]|nr:hypothetical protein [Rubrivivax sp.]
MTDPRPSPRAVPPTDAIGATQLLRQLGARAHQLRAATRAADHYIAQDAQGERDTGSWLVSCAVAMAADVAADLDSLARAMKERHPDPALLTRIAPLRVRAHQLHAATKAADHFLDQDNRDDQDTGSWLIATAHTLAEKLAAEMDDTVAAPRRPNMADRAAELRDPTAAPARRVGADARPLRGAA